MPVDTETFEDIYTSYFNRVYTFLFRMCGNEDLAEELTQETFFQAFRSFYKFRGDSELFTWLASIAKFTWNSLIIGDDETDPEKIVQKEEMAAAVRKVLDKIPAKYRDVVVLRIYAELPFSEIAESLKISESSAKVLFFRAKKMLLEELKHENLV